METEEVFNTIDEEVKAAERQMHEATRDPLDDEAKPKSNGGDAHMKNDNRDIRLEIDYLSLLYENLYGTVRFRLVPPKGVVLRHVKLSLSNKQVNVSESTELMTVDDGSNLPPLARDQALKAGNLPIGLPPLKAGAYTWSLALSYVQDNLWRRFEANLSLVVGSQAKPKDVVINIVNNIKASEAGTVSVNNSLASGMASALWRGEDPTAILRKLQHEHAWCVVQLFNVSPLTPLPPWPKNAVKTDRIVLDIRGRRLILLSGEKVVIGRGRDCDICLRPPGWQTRESFTELEKLTCNAVSSHHCFVEPDKVDGQGVVRLMDGGMTGDGMFKKSENGTFWRDGASRIREPIVFRRGDGGTLYFALERVGVHRGNCVSLEAKICSPEFACATCPYFDRTRCGNGRPALALTRPNNLGETFVCLWSCLHLGEIDGKYAGLVIFRKDGAFAWFRGNRSGWLVPGEEIPSDSGAIKVSLLPES